MTEIVHVDALEVLVVPKSHAKSLSAALQFLSAETSVSAEELFLLNERGIESREELPLAEQGQKLFLFRKDQLNVEPFYPELRPEQCKDELLLDVWYDEPYEFWRYDAFPVQYAAIPSLEKQMFTQLTDSRKRYRVFLTKLKTIALCKGMFSAKIEGARALLCALNEYFIGVGQLVSSMRTELTAVTQDITRRTASFREHFAQAAQDLSPAVFTEEFRVLAEHLTDKVDTMRARVIDMKKRVLPEIERKLKGSQAELECRSQAIAQLLHEYDENSFTKKDGEFLQSLNILETYDSFRKKLDLLLDQNRNVSYSRTRIAEELLTTRDKISQQEDSLGHVQSVLDAVNDFESKIHTEHDKFVKFYETGVRNVIVTSTCHLKKLVKDKLWKLAQGLPKLRELIEFLDVPEKTQPALRAAQAETHKTALRLEALAKLSVELRDLLVFDEVKKLEFISRYGDLLPDSLCPAVLRRNNYLKKYREAQMQLQEHPTQDIIGQREAAIMRMMKNHQEEMNQEHQTQRRLENKAKDLERLIQNSTEEIDSVDKDIKKYSELLQQQYNKDPQGTGTALAFQEELAKLQDRERAFRTLYAHNVRALREDS